ncbi:MAG: ABC transporter ATP-binding protein [Isosphaeraceae bacterium]|nr:ABC transporter ATP-binding protein [Isosphaeraceae bacterium]
MLEAIELTKTYGDHTVLDRLSLHVGPGEIYCLLGANGAGKTTTINLFLDFIPRSSGTARIHGMDVAEHSLETKRHLAYIPEQVNLYGNLSGLENLSYLSRLGGRTDLGTDDLLEFLSRVGLTVDTAGRPVRTYSKGMRQKVGIAAAIAKRAGVLLLDEPTSGLDPKSSNEFSELLLMLRAEGVAILMATHDLFRAKETGTRVGIMKHGRLVASLDTSEVGHTDLERIYLEHMHD